MARRRGGRAQEPAEAEPVVEEPQPVQETPADEDMGDAGDNDEQEQEQHSLVFNEELSWRPAKPIPSATLLARLERLSRELADFDQGAVELDSLKTVAAHLAHRNLLQHKDRGVKAYTACCLVDLLRLYVPEAPFTEEQLKMMFTLFVKDILPALHDPSNPYDSQHKYVLTSLTEVKSILLICDIHGADDLLLRLFNSAFDGVSTSSKASPDEQVAKDVEIHLTDMLMHLIEESPGSVPASVIDAIISQFLRAAPPGGSKSKEANGKQATLLHKTEPPAYIMAKNICNGCADKMSRYVSQYFSDVILNASGFATKNGYGHGDDDDDEEDANAGPSEADLKSLRQAHALIRELWRAAPTILQNVVPQLDAELSADNVHLRHIATEAFGDMISGIGAAGPPPPPALDPAAWPPVRLMDEPGTPAEANVLTAPFSPQSFAQTHHATYRNFVGRKNDKSGTIRAAWVIAVGYILSTSAGGIGLSREDETELVRGLIDKLSDNEEKVRLAAVKAIELFQFRDVILKLGATGGVDKEGSLFASLSDRCRDRKASVRVDAMVLLGKLWAVGATDIEEGQEAVTACLGGVPSRIINSFYANDSDLNVLLDRVMFECLVPLKFPLVKGKSGKGGSSKSAMSQAEQDSIRAERILLMLKSLDTPAQKAFFAMQARQPQFAKGVAILIQQCEAYNGGVIDSNDEKVKATLAKTIDWIGRFFPDALKVRADLQKFAKLNERRSYQLVKYAIESESDFKTVRRAISELITKLQASNAAVALDTIIPLLYRSSSLMFNRSHLATIMDCSKSDKGGLAAVAHLVLNDISQRNPDLFKAHAEELRKEIIEQAPSDSKTNDPSVVDILKAYASYAKKYPNDVALDRSFIQTLTNYAMYGTPPKAAKFAINIMLAKNDDKSKVTATNLLRKTMQNLEYGKSHFLNKLATISQLERLAPSVTMDEGDKIQDVTIKSILRQVHTDARPGADKSWVDDADMDEEIQAKLLALRILTNQAISNEDEADSETRVKTVFKLLKTFVVSEGEFCKVKDTPQHHKKRLRLLAGLLMLKLCTVKKYDEQLDPVTFNKLAELVQDSEVQVRHRFMEKLQSYLTHGKLRARFLTMLFLVAFEPAPELKSRVETWLRSRALYYSENKKEVMESIFGRLIPLLAHHPDYSAGVDDLADFANYFLFYLNAVATESNLGLISKYAERTKQTRDAINADASENLYVLSDLAQAIIRKFQEKRNWSFRVYPGKVGLATGLFAPLPSSEVAEEIAKKQYIPEALDEKLDNLLRSFERKKKRKSMHEPGEPSAKRSRTQIKTVIREKAAPKQHKAKKAKKVKAARPKKQPSSLAAEPSERRRSSRVTKTSDYKERDDKDDEEEMLDGVAEWKYGDDSSDEESGEEEVESGEEESGDAEEEEAAGEEEEEEEESPVTKNGRRSQAVRPAVKTIASAATRRGGRSKRASQGNDMDTDD
ncbi:bimD protein [Cordyceps fumosorosea ARSEF 2679]|uniref:BimD protein n=1 Tax=Cordyceps fumosorosea (strain ARSEF 2679) TaxID=1081104 RepID=A0A168ERJ8_CORFA|nr:bimD protein [Cordyceps fumosorosea ARSEF 2679]OAA74130.1 bimD protein [Cordyceps fumosorosea ARSEF 2679]